DSRASTSSSS
nr:Chain B, Ubiquitin-conjugating enzyme E2 E1 [Homo sapiens]